MIDFSKWVLPGSYWSQLCVHPLLEWKHTYQESTSELLKSESNFRTINFIYQKPKFSKDYNEREIRLQFSFAQVLFNGYNHKDPNISEIQEVIRFLQCEFDINPKDAICIFIEAGCNVEPPIQFSLIDSSLIAYDGIPFDGLNMPGKAIIGRECYVSQTGVKIYGKQLKYPELNLPDLLRCENKTFKMGYLKTPEPITLDNLTSKEVLNALKDRLIENLNKVIYKENLDLIQLTRTQAKLIERWSNPKYIECMKRVRPQTYQQERSTFKRLMPENGIWKEIINRVIEKWDQLSTESKSKAIWDFTLIETQLKKEIVSEFT